MKLKDLLQLAQQPPRPTTPAERLAKRYLNVEDMRKAAGRRLPGSIFDYIEGGGEDESSLRRNRDAFGEWALVPFWGGVQGPDLSTTILGETSTLPMTLSPTGGTRLFHPQGEVAVARAAAKVGLPYGLAHLSTTTLEDVAEAAPSGRRWFNMELVTDPVELQAMLDRVEASGYDTLLVNLDVRDIGHRERDYRNGFTAPPSIRPKSVVEGVFHPGWSLGFVMNEAIAFPNLDSVRPTGPLSSSPDMWRTLLSGSYTPTDWSHLAELRRRWKGKIVLKGVVSAADAVTAIEYGMDGIQISNHGDRQLDHMATPLDVLPEIAAATGGRIELILDGGVRRGTDVIKALALGAHAVAIGRPYLYGLAAHGQVGVEHVLELFRSEIARAMLLLGCSSIEEVRSRGPEIVRRHGPGLVRAPQTV